MKSTKNLLEFWEEQMKQSHRSSNYFFRKSPSHYHMMLLIMAYHKQNLQITVEELKTNPSALHNTKEKKEQRTQKLYIKIYKKTLSRKGSNIIDIGTGKGLKVIDILNQLKIFY